MAAPNPLAASPCRAKTESRAHEKPGELSRSHENDASAVGAFVGADHSTLRDFPLPTRGEKSGTPPTDLRRSRYDSVSRTSQSATTVIPYKSEISAGRR